MLTVNLTWTDFSGYFWMCCVSKGVLKACCPWNILAVCLDSSTCWLIDNAVFAWRKGHLCFFFFLFFFLSVLFTVSLRHIPCFMLRLLVTSILTGWAQLRSWTMTTSSGRRTPSTCLFAKKTGEETVKAAKCSCVFHTWIPAFPVIIPVPSADKKKFLIHLQYLSTGTNIISLGGSLCTQSHGNF